MSEIEVGLLEKSLQRTKKKNKTGRVVILAVLLLAISVAGFFLWRYATQPVEYEFDQEAMNGILAGSDEDRLAILNEVVDQGMFNVKMNTMLTFLNGSEDGTVNIQNIPGNHFYCKVAIALSDGTEVYTSKGLKPGQYIETIRLKENLAKGSYEGMAYFTVTDPETLKSIATLSAPLTISVLN